MKEKIKVIREELIANIFRTRGDVKLELQETWVLDSEEGIVRAIEGISRVIAFCMAIKEELITLLRLNKLLMEEHEDEGED